jgi:AcrR family transcriptional regulator
MTDRQTPRERRHERTREAILTAARELIAEKGADNLSLREIARRIDYSPAGLYEYFGSKEEIICALCDRGNAQLASYLKRVPVDLPLEDYLVELLEAYLDFARQNPELYIVMFLQLTIGVSEFPREVASEDSFAFLARAVQRGIDDRTFYTSDTYGLFEIAYSMWAMAHGMAMLQVSYLRDFNFDFQTADRETVRTFINGLKQPRQ